MNNSPADGLTADRQTDKRERLTSIVGEGNN